MSDEELSLREVDIGERGDFTDYLLLADESEDMVNSYINEGDMFAVYQNNKIIGVALFIFHTNHIVELKNIALDNNTRGKGLGKAVIEGTCSLYQRKGIHKMIVGTANSSIANIAFYQKCRFRMIDIKKDFFLKYPEPIIEDGIRAVDMIMFERILNKEKVDNSDN